MKIARRRIFGATVAGVLALASLTACGGGSTTSESSAPDNGGKVEGTVRLWLMDGSVSDEAQQVLKDEFAKENPGATLSIEIQQWDGIVSKLQTSLASKDESPDLVETGSTQTSTFSEVGAFAPVDDLYSEVGGDKLIQSFVEAGTVDGKKYALPLYAGARGIFYRTDLFKAAGIEAPKTLDDLESAIMKLQEANPDQTEDFSGIYLAANDLHGLDSWFFAAGGDYATKDGDKWTGKLSSDDSIAALTQIQRLLMKGTKYALDSQQGQQAFQNYFNDGKVGILIGTGNIGAKIDKALWDADKVGVFAIPSKNAGTVGQTFLGGSNISIAANAKNPAGAKAVMKAIFSDPFQQAIAKDGWAPGNTDYASKVSGAFGEISQDVIKNSKLTPNTPQWGVSAEKLLKDMWVELAQGADVKQVASKYDAQFTEALNKK